MAPAPKRQPPTRRQKIGAVVWLLWMGVALIIAAFTLDCILFSLFHAMDSDRHHAFYIVAFLNFIFGCVITFSIFSEDRPTHIT